MLRICSLFGLVFLLAHPAQAQISGLLRVIDGDTIDVGQTRIRLHGIDAPERGQPCTTLTGQSWACGDWVTRQLHDRFGGAQARCDDLGKDGYGRTLARCFVGATQVNATLVREGLAFAYRKYSTEYVAQEEAAALADLGIHGFVMQSPARYRLTGGRAAQIAPEGCTIKGNIGRKGVRIYHMPDQAFYTRTWITAKKGERWFCSEAQARASGWRRAKR